MARQATVFLLRGIYLEKRDSIKLKNPVRNRAGFFSVFIYTTLIIPNKPPVCMVKIVLLAG